MPDESDKPYRQRHRFNIGHTGNNKYHLKGEHDIEKNE